MKTLITLLALTVLAAACSPRSPLAPPAGTPGSSTGGATPTPPTPGRQQQQGGVDVGNMLSAIVPGTNAVLNYPSHWQSDKDQASLRLSNRTGSRIEFKRATLNLSSPSALSLQRHLSAKHPERRYRMVALGGFEGVRAEIANTGEMVNSDIYLISDTKDFVHIESSLRKSDEGIEEGERIILTTRVRYLGVAYKVTEPRTVTLKERSAGSPDHHAYSFWGDCFTYSDQGCNPEGGVAVAYEGEFRIGTSGGEHGRIVDLGTESEVPFASIHTEGQYLIGPSGKTSLADIYTEFTPKAMHQDIGRIQLQPGHVYLVRTKDWPDEDLITKIRVEQVDLGKSATLTYQKLAYVPRKQLQKQVDALIQFTRKFEQPLSTGEVVLFHREVWGNYYFASFNFKYSNSGNLHITNNHWNLRFERGCDGKAALLGSSSDDGKDTVVDLGKTDLSQVKISDFKVRSESKERSGCGHFPTLGHTFAIVDDDYDDTTGNLVPSYGAVQVLEVGENASWVRLKFRRVHFGKIK